MFHLVCNGSDDGKMQSADHFKNVNITRMQMAHDGYFHI